MLQVPETLRLDGAARGMLPPARALCDRLVDDLRQRVLRHEFAPGQAMDERSLVGEYGISRTPVREALKRLQYEGLLVARPHYGMHVAVISAEERREAERLYRLLHTQARRTPPAQREASLLGHMLALAEGRLRLAYGPAFEQRMAAKAGARQRAA